MYQYSIWPAVYRVTMYTTSFTHVKWHIYDIRHRNIKREREREKDL